ncbi:MAG TPA: DUF5668 domain-containing protein [Bacteroidota bacterium]|nr:DUF5668 domain-containing protein [Bacteroidota bacterium]
MHDHNRRGGRILFGGVLLVAGLALLLRNTGLLPIGSLWQYWPVILIVAGAAKLLNSRPEQGTTHKEDPHGT